MLSLDDERWANLKGGYGIAFDPRPLLHGLEAGTDDKHVWDELWGELHHQGDVGDASYAAVPHLVRIHLRRNLSDWNTYAMVACIELARGQGNNPELPDWIESGYFKAINELAKFGLTNFDQTNDKYVVRGILSVLALNKGARTYAQVLLERSEEELLDFEELDLNS
jgi:hypothetical protein